MRARSTLVLTWMVTGMAAVAGSILGNALGKTGLMVGAVIGGIAGVDIAVAIAARLRWIDRTDRMAGFLGGLVGFALAAPIAVFNLHTPVTPVLSCALTGVGVLVGVGIGRRRS